MKRVNFGTSQIVTNIAKKPVLTRLYKIVYKLVIALCMNRICNRQWLLKFKIKVKLIT